ncbi:hypothetical protein FE3_046 [Escherichia phage vB_EcoS_fFiEco03]|uniref:hypothetical protein n=2 Tax=unclassified Kagunavirus TaxID=2565499 RepID=UPI0018601AAC|nr:hypothetical protein QCF70_gp47 [Escherichia phage vB_EcoS_fFiEco03]QNO11684.1 hypothetical protein FE3_046 [Escherichia phage vB_EcoS_fFiEco03]
MNYGNLTDIEINARVSRALYGNVSRGHQMELASGGVDYCNRVEDAWPIIIDNHISIECVTVNRHTFTYRAYHSASFTKSTHENPLRAAMIVFLRMHEVDK